MEKQTPALGIDWLSRSQASAMVKDLDDQVERRERFNLAIPAVDLVHVPLSGIVLVVGCGPTGHLRRLTDLARAATVLAVELGGTAGNVPTATVGLRPILAQLDLARKTAAARMGPRSSSAP